MTQARIWLRLLGRAICALGVLRSRLVLGEDELHTLYAILLAGKYGPGIL